MDKLRSEKEHYLYQAGKEIDLADEFLRNSGLLLSIRDLQAYLKEEVINTQESTASSQNPKSKGSNN